jgi:hypothetical protein
MQLLKLPINLEDPEPTDICHGRNSSAHEVTRNVVPVSGEILLSTLNRGKWRHLKLEFTMPGLMSTTVPALS